MTNKVFKEILIELVSEITPITKDDSNKTTVKDWVNYLRTLIKYEQLDLEATRRENESLKKLLDEK